LTVFLLLSAFLPADAARAESSDDGTPVLAISADRQFRFAEEHFDSGEFYRAIGEYQRFLFFFPEDDRAGTAMHRIAMSYYRGQRFTDAIGSFERLISRFPAIDLAVHSRLMISECFSQSKQPARALANLHNLLAMAEDPDVRDEASYRAAWIHLEQASWESARSFLDRISLPNRTRYGLRRLSASLVEENRPALKDPETAGFLSILPGAGYAYLGRYRDAFTALVVNGGLIYAATRAFVDGNPALGGVVAFAGTGFYFGNIFGAVSSTHKYNRDQTARFIDRLKADTKIQLSADARERSVWVSLRVVF